MILVKTLPELVKITQQYKNPYLLCHYKGIDWYNYINQTKTNEIYLSNHLLLLSKSKNQYYKLNPSDFIYVLHGSIVINGYKTLYDHQHFLCEDHSLIKGNDSYDTFSTFLHYKHF